MRALLVVLLLAFVPLGGCGTVLGVFGLEQVEADTANKRLIVLEYSYQAALKTVDAQITAGTINSSNSEQVTAYLDKARAALDAARIALQVEGSDTIAYINSANVALAQLIQLLKSNEEDS